MRAPKSTSNPTPGAVSTVSGPTRRRKSPKPPPMARCTRSSVWYLARHRSSCPFPRRNARNLVRSSSSWSSCPRPMVFGASRIFWWTPALVTSRGSIRCQGTSSPRRRPSALRWPRRGSRAGSRCSTGAASICTRCNYTETANCWNRSITCSSMTWARCWRR